MKVALYDDEVWTWKIKPDEWVKFSSDTVVDVPEETLTRWRDITSRFEEMQSEMERAARKAAK